MSKGQSLDELRKKTQEDCVHQSLVAGGKAAAWALATAGTVVFLANQYLPTFRTSLGVSGKTALIVSPAFGMYFLQSELTMNECARKRKWTLHDAQH
ncbi:g7111 [Coccomyxa elongata]